MDLLRALIRRGLGGKGFQQPGMASEKVKGLKGDRVPAGSAHSHLAFVFQTKLWDGRNAGVETPRGEEPPGGSVGQRNGVSWRFGAWGCIAVLNGVGAVAIRAQQRKEHPPPPSLSSPGTGLLGAPGPPNSNSCKLWTSGRSLQPSSAAVWGFRSRIFTF